MLTVCELDAVRTLISYLCFVGELCGIKDTFNFTALT